MSKTIFFDAYLANGGKITYVDEYLKQQDNQQEGIILLGGFIQEFFNLLPNLHSQNKEIFLLHPLNFCRDTSIKQILYEVECEEAVIALLAMYLITQTNEEVLEFKKNLDVGYLASESNLSEEELEVIQKVFVKSFKKTLVIGEDFYNSKKVENIARILALMSQDLAIEIVFLEAIKVQTSAVKKPISNINEVYGIDGMVVYIQARNSIASPYLEASKQFAVVGKVCNNQVIDIQMDNRNLKVSFIENQFIKGMIGILWVPKKEKNSYCYKKISINKVA
ncbi:hypothetical protein [Helicobacter mesocricetorum]|uniref:hypothetical protein n=1 Tax=Helicobacter mesocricetorum TaxID=87012 RepID=UPI000CF14F17|nr:hypothetical protein [Helicobacter mesocricetorum]